jgi:hypothetical protein
MRGGPLTHPDGSIQAIPSTDALFLVLATPDPIFMVGTPILSTRRERWARGADGLCRCLTTGASIGAFRQRREEEHGLAETFRPDHPAHIGFIDGRRGAENLKSVEERHGYRPRPSASIDAGATKIGRTARN